MIKYLILILLLSQGAFGEDIHIGDRIALRIKGADREEIVRGLQGFQVEEIDEGSEGTEVAVRSYEVGTHRIALGDRYFEIEIAPTIGEDEGEIYRDLSDASLLTYRRRPLPGVFIAGVLLLGGTLLWGAMLFIKRRIPVKKIHPREEYYDGMDKLGEDYLYEVSFYFRRYYDHLTGEKTLSGVYLDNEAGGFLRRLDHMKFSRRSDHDREDILRESLRIIKEREGEQKDD